MLYKVSKVNFVEREFLYNMIKKFLGDLVMAKAGIMILNNTDTKGIIRVNHYYVDEVKTALALINNYHDNEIRVETIKVSGVINKLKEEGV